MAHITDDRVLESSTGTTGAWTMLGALGGHTALATARRPDGTFIQVGDTFYACRWGVDASGNANGAFEAGLFTYSAANQATLTTVLSSSNSNAAVTWGAGTKHFAIAALASRTVQLDNELSMTLPAVSVSAVSASPADTVKVFSRKIAGRMTLKYVGPSGIDQTLQDKISENGGWLYQPNNGTTVGLNIGLGLTSGGTVSHPTPSATAPASWNQQKRTRWANVVTTQNQMLGIRSATAEKRFWRGNAAGLGGFNFHARFGIELWPAATVRKFVGLNDSNAGWVISDTLTGNGCGLWHDAAEAATVLNFVTRNGTTATKVAIPLGSALAVGQWYDFWMWCAPNSSTITYKLTDGQTGIVRAEAATSTTIPLNTAFLGPEIAMSNGTANITVTTTGLGLAGASCQSDN